MPWIWSYYTIMRENKQPNIYINSFFERQGIASYRSVSGILPHDVITCGQLTVNNFDKGSEY